MLLNYLYFLKYNLILVYNYQINIYLLFYACKYNTSKIFSQHINLRLFSKYHNYLIKRQFHLFKTTKKAEISYVSESIRDRNLREYIIYDEDNIFYQFLTAAIINNNGKDYIEFYGSSSEEANAKHYGGLANYRSSEGKKVKIGFRKNLDETIRDILGGIRSSCTYVGA